jgi:GNAT superfamily N-acetyltransferase
MTPTWFRVPEWVWSVNDEASGKKARAWVYLLGSWHAGNDPGIREVMRGTGYGGGMTTALVRDVARWARDAGARLPEQYLDSAGTVPSANKPRGTPVPATVEASAGTVDRFCGNDSRARVPYETRRDETRVEPDTENAPAPAVAPTHTEDQNHDDQPTRPPSPESRPDAYRPPDGSGGHAERGGKATERGGPTTDDPPAVPSARGTGPAVAAWDRLDAIRRKNIKGAGTLKLTPAMRKSLGERLKEYSEDDLAAMVEWVTGCRCGSKNCRSCGHLQPGGYTHPQTYLRPDKCSDYVDKATRAGFQSRPTHEEQVDWSESDAARLVVQRVLDTSADIHHRDERILWLAKCTISHMGKRAAWRSKGGTIEWISAWRKEWPASVEAWERKQQQEGAAK